MDNQKLHNYSELDRDNIPQPTWLLQPWAFVAITDTELNQSQTFEDNVWNSNQDIYVAREPNTDPIVLKSRIGFAKAAEFAFSHLPNSNQPDLTIYPANQKSYEPDLIINNLPFSIKCVRESNTTEYRNWSFRINDNHSTADTYAGLCVVSKYNPKHFYLLRPIKLSIVRSLLSNTTHWKTQSAGFKVFKYTTYLAINNIPMPIWALNDIHGSIDIPLIATNFPDYYQSLTSQIAA